MTNLKDIYCIDINWIDARIKELEKEGISVSELIRFQLQLKRIAPLIEDVMEDIELMEALPWVEGNKQMYLDSKQFNLCTKK